MRVITLEGLDKAGKHTLAMKLEEQWKKEGLKVKRSEFTRYDTPTGKLLQQYLKGGYEVNNFSHQLLLLSNKQEQQPRFWHYDELGYDILLLDRYEISQFVYASYFILLDWSEGRISESIAKSQMKIINEWISNSIRKTDLGIYVDITPEVSVKRKGQHGANDKYEVNMRMHKFVRGLYQTMVEQDRTGMIQVNGLNQPDQVLKDALEQKPATRSLFGKGARPYLWYLYAYLLKRSGKTVKPSQQPANINSVLDDIFALYYDLYM